MLILDGIIDSKENLEIKRALAVKIVPIGFKTKDICSFLYKSISKHRFPLSLIKI